MKDRHSAGEHWSTGPVLSLESRMNTVPGWLVATSTQFPPFEEDRDDFFQIKFSIGSLPS